MNQLNLIFNIEYHTKSNYQHHENILIMHRTF